MDILLIPAELFGVFETLLFFVPKWICFLRILEEYHYPLYTDIYWFSNIHIIIYINVIIEYVNICRNLWQWLQWTVCLIALVLDQCLVQISLGNCVESLMCARYSFLRRWVTSVQVQWARNKRPVCYMNMLMWQDLKCSTESPCH